MRFATLLWCPSFFVRHHMAGSKQLLSDTSKREMQRVHWHVHAPGSELFQDYGLGLDLERLANGRVTFGHGGGFPGQITRSMADPASGLVVAVLTNCADGPAAEMARGIFKVLDFFEHHPAAPRARWRGERAESLRDSAWPDLGFGRMTGLSFSTSPEAMRCSDGLTPKAHC